jgi:hypothetical protein
MIAMPSLLLQCLRYYYNAVAMITICSAMLFGAASPGDDEKEETTDFTSRPSAATKKIILAAKIREGALRKK